MTGDEKTPDDSTRPPEPTNSANPAPKAVFSDDFDDPEKRYDLDELPEEEPLTPELVEEEAIRGDFMLRWAAIFLAVLMAFSQISDTRPLVMIRSGDQMRSEGFLPARTDQFAFTLEGQPVTNVSWLFDHLVSLSWLAGGENGLSVLKVLFAAISAFLLVRISIPGVSSWWSSICAVFAIVTCSSDFMPVPELITVLGMVLTMRLIAKHRQGKADGLIWKMPLLFAVWCNFDSHAWVGAGVFVAYAVGSGLSGRIAARKQSLAAVAEQKTLAVPALLGVLALLVNPFPVGSLLAPLATYSTEYPAMQAQRRLTTEAAKIRFDGRVDYYSVFHPDAFVLFDHTQVAGLSVILMAFVALLLSRSSRDLGFLFALLFASFLTVLAAHELPAASVVAAVVAGIAAQDWYRRSFNMKYSTETSELLFSRGGRAATVLGLAVIGFCVVASRLPGATPLGLGFDRETQITMSTFREQIEKLKPEARILHTLIEQGDMLIWNGRKSFVDSRLVPFGRRENLESVFGKHGNVLDTMFLLPPNAPPPTPVSSDPKEKEKLEADYRKKQELARATLKEFDVTHVISRLAPPGKGDFTTLRNLTATGEWVPTDIGAAVAVLEKVSRALSQEEYAKKAVNLPQMAFKDWSLPPVAMRQFAAPPGFYEKWVYRKRTATNANKRLGINYLELTVREPQSLAQAQVALASLTLAIRHFNIALVETPDDAETFRMLGQCYMMLGMMEQMLAGPNAGNRLAEVRYLQSVTALRQATLIDPENKTAWVALFQAYQQRNRLDLAADALGTWLTLEEETPQDSGDEYEESMTQMYLRKRELEDQLTQSDDQLAESIKAQLEAFEKQAESRKAENAASGEAMKAEEVDAEEAARVFMAAMSASSAGRPQKALETLREKSDIVRSNPFASILLGQCLLESGQLEEAHQTLAMVSTGALKRPQDLAGIDWQLYTGISQLGIADYPSAVDTWKSQLTMMEQQASNPLLYSGVMASLPLVADVNLAMNEAIPVWPFRNALLTSDTIQASSEGRAEAALLLALLRIEEGENEIARKLLRQIVVDFGETRARALASAYFVMMDDEAAELLNSSGTKTWEEFSYPGEKLPEAAEPAAGSSTKPPLMPSVNPSPR